jgi:protein O-mannosyl-transferase
MGIIDQTCRSDAGFASVTRTRSLAGLGDRKLTILIALLLFGAVVGVFWPSLRCGFLFWDDTADVLEEGHVSSGLSWQNIAWAFSTLDHCNWYPLTWLSHMLDCQVYGLNPWGHHLTSILIHALNSVLVFLVFRTMTGAVWRSLAVALLFGLHPLRVESVTWICERKDVLSVFFWMLTLLAYTRYVEKSTARSPQSKVFYGLALLFFSLGLMSKAMVVTLPFVLLLLDYWPLGRVTSGPPSPGSGAPGGRRGVRIHRLVVEKLPFLGLTIADSWVTFKAQKLGGLTAEMNDLPLSDKAGNALISYARYVGKFFWPETLSVYYPHPVHWPWFAVVGAGLFVLGISILAVGLRRHRPYLLVGWFWYLGTLVPVIGLVQLMSQAMANRYTYIPMIGFTLALVWGLGDWIKAWRYKTALMLAIGALALTAGAVKTRREIGYFKDDITLWRRAVAVTEGEYNWCPHYALGIVLVPNSQSGDALAEFRESVRINPNYAKSQLCLSRALEDKNRLHEALPHCQRALEIDPRFGLAWFHCGIMFLKKGELDKAIDRLERATQCEPNNSRFRAALGAARNLKQQGLAANRTYRVSVNYYPDRPYCLNNLAWFLATNPDAGLRNGEEAVRLAERACQLTHYQQTVPVMTLAAAYAEAGRFDEAITNAQLAGAMALKSDDKLSWQQTELMLSYFREHLPHYEWVLIDPAYPSGQP